MRNTLMISSAVFIAVLGLLLWFVLGPGANSPTEEPAGTTGTAGAAAAAADDVPARPDCPALPLGADLPCLGGQATPAKEQISVINVWAWWCEPCREELPALQAFAKRHPEYHVVGVHADASAARGAGLLNDLNVDLPSFQDSTGAFAAARQLPGVVPITVVLAGDGTVLGTKAQAFHSAEEIEAAVAGMVQR